MEASHIIAFFAAAADEARKVEAGARDDDLQKWLGHCLRVVQDAQELEWASQQLREDQAQLSFLARTPTQRIFDVMQKREAMGVSYTPETLIDLYERNDQFSAKSEKITRGRCMCFVFSSPFFPFSWGLRLTCGVLGPRLFGDGPCFATRQHFAGGLG